MYNLQQSINWALPYIEYSPLTAGTAGEPAVSIATLVRNSLMTPPLSWPWNRNENSTVSTQSGVQDYVIPIIDFGFLEKVSLTDVNGSVFEVKDVYNNLPLSIVTSNPSGPSGGTARPSACAVLLSNPGTNIKIRFMAAPNAIYKINLTYQSAAVPFTSNIVTSCGNASGGNTIYNGTFTPSLFPANSSAMIVGFITNPGNNGGFSVVSCTATVLTLANPSGIAETNPASAVNAAWSPIPDYYSDIYNWLFLSEALAVSDDSRAQLYRQRGVAAFLAKSDGLTDLQRNIFMQQWGSYTRENQALVLKVQQGQQARSI